MKPLTRKPVSIVSPLRFPGSKRRLASFIAKVIQLNHLKPKLFVEPFCGGASVALQLLSDGVVEQAGLGDKDARVASFWRVVFDDTDWLVEQLHKVPVTVEQWKYFHANSFETDRERALACLFLNRTSFSGVMAKKVGPIGGWEQKSQYTIGCRFKPRRLEERIRQAATLRERVLFVHCGDWSETVAKAKAEDLRSVQVFFYFDPPFIEKGRTLYLHNLSKDEHSALCEVASQIESPWLVSYDPDPGIAGLYVGHGLPAMVINSYYTGAPKTNPGQAGEFLFTNLPYTVPGTRIWRTCAEWAGKV